MDHNKVAAAVFDKLASHYQNKYMDVSLYSASLDRFCMLLPQNASVLDVACGPGNVTRYLLDRRSDLRILGTDIAPNMIALAKHNNPDAQFQVLDGREIGSLHQSFDAVMCAFFFPYLSAVEAEAFIGAAAGLLVPGGVLYLSTIEDLPSRSGWQEGSTGDKIYMNYFSKEMIRTWMKHHKLRIEFEENILHPSQIQSTARDLILIGIKSSGHESQ